MATVLLVIHLMVAVALIVAVLLQKSEGGALGMGGGGAGGGMMTGRGAADALTRTTAILGGIFFLTSISLTILSQTPKQKEGLINGVGAGSLLKKQGGGEETKQPVKPAGPQVPLSE